MLFLHSELATIPEASRHANHTRHLSVLLSALLLGQQEGTSFTSQKVRELVSSVIKEAVLLHKSLER